MAETSKADGGRLTTHVLDTATGKPAAGLSIALYHLEGDARTHLKTVVTNADGRCDAPLLAGAEFRTGEYELVFARATICASRGQSLPKPAFLDWMPIRSAWPNRCISRAAAFSRPMATRPTGS